MGVDRGRPELGVAEELLDGAHVGRRGKLGQPSLRAGPSSLRKRDQEDRARGTTGAPGKRRARSFPRSASRPETPERKATNRGPWASEPHARRAFGSCRRGTRAERWPSRPSSRSPTQRSPTQRSPPQGSSARTTWARSVKGKDAGGGADGGQVGPGRSERSSTAVAWRTSAPFCRGGARRGGRRVPRPALKAPISYLGQHLVPSARRFRRSLARPGHRAIEDRGSWPSQRQTQLHRAG